VLGERLPPKPVGDGVALLRGEPIHWGLVGGADLVIAGVAIAQRPQASATIRGAPP